MINVRSFEVGKGVKSLTALEHEDLPRRDVGFDLLRGKGGPRTLRRQDLVDFGPGLVQNVPRAVQLCLINRILSSSLWPSDRSMDQLAGRSQLKGESEVLADQGVGLEVGDLGLGI